MTLGVVIIVSIPIPLIILLYMEWTILRPLNSIMYDLNRIISSRAFGERIRLITGGQLGTVAMQVNAILQSLNHTLNQVSILRKRCRKMEKRERLVSEMLDSVVNMVPDMIVVLDQFDLTVLKVNDAFFDKLRYHRVEVLNGTRSLINPKAVPNEKACFCCNLYFCEISATFLRLKHQPPVVPGRSPTCPVAISHFSVFDNRLGEMFHGSR